MTIHTANHVQRSIRPLEVDGRNYGYTQRCTIKGRWHYVAFGRRQEGETVRYVPVVAAKTRAEAEAEARKLIITKQW